MLGIRLPVQRQVSVFRYTAEMRSTSAAAQSVALAVRDLRRALGWSQEVLASRAGVSQQLVSAIETRRLQDITLTMASRLLDAMGARLIIDVVPPFLGDRERQRDAAHVRCTTHVAKRLEALGWRVATEVEIGGDRSRGWIDVLAYKPGSGLVLVIEVKTEIRDIGAIERSLGWYQREAWAASRRLGWHPRVVVAGLFLLATQANDLRMAENRDTFRRAFPVRARHLGPVVTGDAAPEEGRFVAMIDPRSRRDAWLRPTRLDGRQTRAPYIDYADFMRRMRR